MGKSSTISTLATLRFTVLVIRVVPLRRSTLQFQGKPGNYVPSLGSSSVQRFVFTINKLNFYVGRAPMDSCLLDARRTTEHPAV